MDRIIPNTFPAVFEGLSPTPADPQLRTGKVRVFYKGLNRNGSFMSENFSNSLALTAYMKPILGSYSVEKKDFEGHEDSQKMKGYGFVLPDSLSWTEHEDDDGVTRTYATYDVVVWAEYWEEAQLIFSRTQSMEINHRSIKGDWKPLTVVDSQATENLDVFVYEAGSIAGLTVLGQEKEPCFEGAAFFTEDESYQKFTRAIKTFFATSGGNKQMVTIANFGDNHEKFNELWNVLNPNFNEEGKYTINAMPYFEEEGKFKVFTSSENKPCINTYEFIKAEGAEEESWVNTHVFDIHEEMDKMHTENSQITEQFNEAVQKLQEKETAFEALNAELENSKTAVSEKDNTISTMKADYEALKAEFDALQNEKSDLSASVSSVTNELESVKNSLREYENAEKDRILERFSSTSIPADTLTEYTNKKEQYSVEELKTALSVEYTNYSLAKRPNNLRVPAPKNGPESITGLEKYRK